MENNEAENNEAVEHQKIKVIKTLEKFGEYLENLNEILKIKLKERENKKNE